MNHRATGDRPKAALALAVTVAVAGLGAVYLAWPSSEGGRAADVAATASAAPPPSATPTRSPSPSPSPSRSPKPSKFPDATNTGYTNAPGYPGSLKRFNGSLKSNTTYKFFDFPRGLHIDRGLENITFIGCRFASNNVEDTTVALHGDNITFDYSTFEPAGQRGKPRVVDYFDGYQYAIDQRARGNFTVDHSDFWGWGNGIQFHWSTKADPVVVRNSWFHHARTDNGGVDHTDAILESYGGPSHMVFDHNTIVSKGNTNGLALQGDGYSDVKVTRNYFSGFGYTVCIGLEGHNNRRVEFTDNTFGTDIRPGWGPMYGWRDGQDNVWRGNKWNVAPGGYYKDKSDDGKYWWPNGTLSDRDYRRR